MAKKFGFTLAEVLIALTIIGVISVLTVPSLIANIESATNQTKLKKAYSTINQIVGMSLADNGYDATDAKPVTAGGTAMRKGIMSIIAKNISGTPVNETAWKSSDGLIYVLDTQDLKITPDNSTEVANCTQYNTDHAQPCGYLRIVTKGQIVDPDQLGGKEVKLDGSGNLLSGTNFQVPFYRNGVYFVNGAGVEYNKANTDAGKTSVNAAARVISGTLGEPTEDPIPTAGQ